MPLFEYHWEDDYELYDKIKAGQITDQSVLVEIARTGVDFSVRTAAFERITDEAVFTGIAGSDKDRDIRLEAIRYITDERTLIQLAQTDRSPNARTAVIKRITNQSALSEIAKTDKDKHVRQAAAKRVTSQRTLSEIVITDRDRYVRLAALEQITDETVLTELLSEWDFPSELIETAVKKITNETTVHELARKHKKRDVRLAAVKCVNDQAVIMELAKDEENSPMLRMAAIKLVCDEDFLIEVAKTDKNSDVQLCAVWCIEDKSALQDFLDNSDNDAIRRTACGNLGHVIQDGNDERCARCGLYFERDYW